MCRGAELTSLTVANINDDGNEITVYLPWTKTKVTKEYIIGGEMAKIIRNYVKLRPKHAKTDRFFVQYRGGKCVNQVIGKHTIAKIPKDIAKFLKLPQENLYTGHSYRHTGTTIAADNGATLEELMRLGPWKSVSVCENYIRKSKAHKRKVGNLIAGAINLPPTTDGGTNSIGSGTEKNCVPLSMDVEHSDGSGGEKNCVPLPMDAENLVCGTDSQEIALKNGAAATVKEVEVFKGGSVAVLAAPAIAQKAVEYEEEPDAVKLLSAACKPLSKTLKELGIKKLSDKENVFFFISELSVKISQSLI